MEPSSSQNNINSKEFFPGFLEDLFMLDQDEAFEIFDTGEFNFIIVKDSSSPLVKYKISKEQLPERKPLSDQEANKIYKDLLKLYQVPESRHERLYPKAASGKFSFENPNLGSTIQILATYREHPDLLTRFPLLNKLSMTHSTGYGICYTDDEIQEVHPIIKETLSDSVVISYTENQNPIIQQQAEKGCTAAAVEMLTFELTHKLDKNALTTRSTAPVKLMISDIQKKGLTALVGTYSNLYELGSLIKANGPAIVSVSTGIKGHVILVDSIGTDEEGARIRDPYHGWEITISLRALRRSITAVRESTPQAIQIEKKTSTK